MILMRLRASIILIKLNHRHLLVLPLSNEVVAQSIVRDKIFDNKSINQTLR